jgi:uncharacterized protein
VTAHNSQAETIAFLSDPATHGVASVEVIETHSAIVVLAGQKAWKLKRAVRYDYLDFSTIELRHAACEAEVRLNRRTAPTIYLGVKPIARAADGSLALDGEGSPVDWVIEMVRFDQDTLLDRLAARRALDLGLMPILGESVAHLHAIAERHFDRGGRAGMQWVIDGNETGFAEKGPGILDPSACERLTTRARAALERHGDLLEKRRRDGWVRWCHGDLHLRNIFLLNGQPTLFDAVEFNPDIACIDVFYDTAFLLMDLWRRDLRDHANAVFNAYLTAIGDIGGLPLLPLFLSCRAAVRAKTSATSAGLQSDDARKREAEAAARDYLGMADALLSPASARLVAIGGLSGSGKSTLARCLASRIGAAPGAVIVRSDVERKAMFGLPPEAPLGPEGYSAAASVGVYRRVIGKAIAIVETGHSAVADAVFAREADRREVRTAAEAAGVRFTGLWLGASPGVLADRLRGRTSDASDATVDVLRDQLDQDTGPIDWHRIDAEGDEQAVLTRAIAVLD